MESNLAPESSIWLPGSNVILCLSLVKLTTLFFSFIGFQLNCSRKLKTFDIVHNIFSEQQVKRGKTVGQKDSPFYRNENIQNISAKNI